MITINGQFTNRRVTGQERFAYQILIELDKICTKEQYELVVPKNANNIPKLENIKIIKYGKAYGSLWEQIFFAFYMITHPKNVSLNLLTIMPVLKTGIICIHDLSYRTHPEFCTTFYSKVSRYWHLFQERLAKWFSPLIFTVSEYSKSDLINYLGIESDRICVLGNGWDHFKDIKVDDGLWNKNPELFSKPFFFSLGSLAPNKNIKWILEVAHHHPQYNFYIGGNANLKAYGTDFKDSDLPNVKFLGYISDGEVKFLMSKCRAFIFPSLFEGFGIPPLEAMSVGAKCIVARSSCLPEIFGNSAYWIDPLDSNINLDDLLSSSVDSCESILNKYTFANFAKLMHNKIVDARYV